MSTKRKADGHSKTMGKLRIMKTEVSRADSERDSGFSDAGSEHMGTMDTTDSEDSARSVVQQGSRRSGSSRAQPSQLAVVSGSYPSLSPMIIMNNVLLKQPGDNPPALKPWGFSPTVEVVQPVVQQPQVVFLQSVVSHRASSSISKHATSRHRRPKKYLPILKSYPKIAPHPGDSTSSSGRGSASSSSWSSSSSSSGSERSSGSASSHRGRSRRDKQQQLQQQKNVSGGSSSSGSTTASLPAPPSSLSPLLQRRLSVPVTDSSASSSPARDRPPQAISRSEFIPSPSLTPANRADNSKVQTLSLPPPPFVAEENSHDDDDGGGGGDHDEGSDPENKRKRFCNTYNILSKSGLLDITLRTKELMRQNRRTQGDLDRLKEHTNLYLQALQSGDASIWVKLQASLQEEDQEK